MRVYRLRTIYDTANLGFSDEGQLANGIVTACLVRQCEFSIATTRVASVNEEGKRNIQINIDSQIFRGHPLLLELAATKTASEGTFAPDVRHELEGRTADAAALLTWSLQGAVGAMLADELSSVPFSGSPSTWAHDPSATIDITDFFPDIRTVASRVAETRRMLEGQVASRRSTAATAMRWWRHAQHTQSASDSYLAYCIIIEATSLHVSTGDTIGQRVAATIATVFPALNQPGEDERIRSIKNTLYKARSKCVHSGMGDFSRRDHVFQLGAATAYACIRFLVDNSVSEPPEHVLRVLRI